MNCTVGALRVVKCICPAVRHQQRLLLCCVTRRETFPFSLFRALSIPLLSHPPLRFTGWPLALLIPPLCPPCPPLSPSPANRLDEKNNNASWFITLVHSLNWFDRFYWAYADFFPLPHSPRSLLAQPRLPFTCRFCQFFCCAHLPVFLFVFNYSPLLFSHLSVFLRSTWGLQSSLHRLVELTRAADIPAKSIIARSDPWRGSWPFRFEPPWYFSWYSTVACQPAFLKVRTVRDGAVSANGAVTDIYVRARRDAP